MKSKPNPNHIEGIYNYCDRWCERCAFTSKCAVFEREADLDGEQNDISNKAFWDNLSQTYSEIINMLRQDAEKHGSALKSLKDGEWEEYKQQQKAGRADLAKHPLLMLCKAYAFQTKALMEQEDLLDQKEKELIQQTELGIVDIVDAKSQAFDLNDCLEIVLWYVYQIQIKFMRALPMMPGEENNKHLISDSNGSAKVALIAVDRCLLAWGKLLHFLPNAEDEIISLLALLQKIRNIGEETFPKARQFKRKGLDD